MPVLTSKMLANDSRNKSRVRKLNEQTHMVRRNLGDSNVGELVLVGRCHPRGTVREKEDGERGCRPGGDAEKVKKRRKESVCYARFMVFVHQRRWPQIGTRLLAAMAVQFAKLKFDWDEIDQNVFYFLSSKKCAV